MELVVFMFVCVGGILVFAGILELKDAAAIRKANRKMA
jgi:hypothetical protein